MKPRLGLFEHIIDELRWTFTGRRGWVIGMGFNLALALVFVSYQDYDPHAPGDIKVANVGLAVTAWVLAGTVSTNHLGSDVDRVVAHLNAGHSMRRILMVKQLALAALLVPFAFAITVLQRVISDRWHRLDVAFIYDIGVVFYWMGVGSFFSVFLPYRPISVRHRLGHLRNARRSPEHRRHVARYGIVQAVPYLLFYAAMPMVHVPYLFVYQFRVFGPVYPNFLDYALTYLGMGLVCWVLGVWLAHRYHRHHHERLIAHLHRSEEVLAELESAAVSDVQWLKFQLGRLHRRRER